ncbi:Uncharacterised protein [Mycobacterium tuberculosis]|nr:Uncharacterised protein [Mycobacterium tuberculosis]CNV77718.1 Uncharacterised protein [Mycobacterium tuberculosis]
MDDGTGLPWLTMYWAAASARLPPAESPTTLTLETPCCAICVEMSPAIAGTTVPAVPPSCTNG